MALIIMICTANACRSPMAEGLLREQLRTRRPDVEVASAGIMASLGPATPEGVTAAAELGADIRRHVSRQIDEAAMRRADLVIAMTREHARWLQSLFAAQRDKVQTLGELACGRGGPDVPDPIGTDLETYRRTAEMIRDLLTAAEPEIMKLISPK